VCNQMKVAVGLQDLPRWKECIPPQAGLLNVLLGSM